MRNDTRAPAGALDWLRVGALSGSFAAHAVILLIVALPMTVPATRPVVKEMVARWIETPPPEAIPEPPPPTVQHKPKPALVRATPVPVAPPTPMSLPAPPAPPVETVSTDAVDAAPGPAIPDIDASPSSGATQALAYATPVTPAYPPASKRALEQGTVVLRVLVDASGAPQRVEIAKSSGHTRLDTAARESVLRAKFRPVMRDGAAVPAWGLVPIAFRLDRG
jgi:protein TonB